MTKEAITSYLSLITYKPGVKIWLEEIEDTLYLAISNPVIEDVSGEGHKTFTTRVLIRNHHLIETELQLLFFVHRIIRLWEDHEMYEWLRVNGIRVCDAHTGDI